MAFLALRNLTMFFMATGTTERAMFGLGGRPLLVNILMTCLTGVDLGLFTMEHDLKRLMRIMTGQTILEDLTLDMRLMAIKAGWN